MKHGKLVEFVILGLFGLVCLVGCETADSPNASSLSRKENQSESKMNMFPITLTSLAAQKVKESMASPSSTLRIDITGDATDGYNYVMNLDTPSRDDDIRDTQHGVSIVVSERHLDLIAGTTVDWESTPNDQGFRFLNPNAKE